MENWFIDYHHALQLRLLGLVVIFGIIFPAVCIIAPAAYRFARRLALRAEYGRRIPRGHLQ